MLNPEGVSHFCVEKNYCCEHVCMCVCMHTCVCMVHESHGTYVVVRGQLCGVSSLLLPVRGFWGSNSGRQGFLASAFTP